MATPSAYPLSWPVLFPRTVSRQAGAFRTSLPAALKNVEQSIKLFGSDSRKRVEDIVISSNVTLGVSKPADPGVAIWFTWDGLTLCIPVDRYSSVESNLQAIHHIIEARRVELRHGSLALVRASVQGFVALPAPPGTRLWHEVLGVAPHDPTDKVRQAYRRAASSAHPDKGGSDARMAAVNAAWAAFSRERGI